MQGNLIFKQLPTWQKFLIDCFVVGVNNLYEFARLPLETELLDRKSEV